MGRLDKVTCAQGDITLAKVDAIVNAANVALRGGGGVDGAIHRAAGPGLLQECIEKYPDGCATGEARITAGHRLAAKFVIHTPGPVYQDGACGEPEKLAACYRNSIELAAANGCRSIAFPAISCGVFGYPVRDAAQVAMETLAAALEAHPEIEEVQMLLFGADTLDGFTRAKRSVDG